MLEHLHEGTAFARLEWGKDQPLRFRNGAIDVLDHAIAGRGDVQSLGTPIGGTIGSANQPALLQAAHDVTDGRTVERDGVAQRRLIKARIVFDRDQRRVLHRRKVESLRLFQKQRRRDLLQPADQVARHVEQMAVVVRHWRAS